MGKEALRGYLSLRVKGCSPRAALLGIDQPGPISFRGRPHDNQPFVVVNSNGLVIQLAIRPPLFLEYA